jgi:DMSO/TMAO reductase YedYZ molybdopterin-dependent catalytic subunit
MADNAARGTPVGRRVFLGLVGAGAAGILWGAKASDFLENTLGNLVSKDGTGLASLLPIGRFRIYSVTGDLPSRSKAAYTLRVHGLVDRPLQLRYDEIRAMTPLNLTRDFQCVTGWRVHDVGWTGVRLADVLDRAGVRPTARALRLTSFDGAYTESLTLEQARRADVMVAYQLDGKDISSAHGGPVRLYIAPMYGYKSIKWLETIEVVDRVIPGYWEDRGYDVDGWIGKSNGRDDQPVS